MKAAVLVAPEHHEVTSVDEPTPTPGTVMVRMEWAGICGSDLHVSTKTPPPGRFPSIPGFSGHECVGVVEDSNGSSFKRGQRVLYLPPNMDGFVQWAAASPADCVPIPEDLDAKTGVLAQQLGTTIWACKRLDPVIDQDVAIIGQGPAGLNFTALMRGLGARKIITIERHPARIEASRRAGATTTLDSQTQSPIEAVKELTAGQGVDLVIEAVGREETVNLAYELVRPGGTVLLFGIPKAGIFPGFKFDVAFRRYARTMTIAGAQQEPGHSSFRLAMDYIRQGRVDATAQVSHCLPLDQIDQAFQMARTGAERAVKLLIDLR